MDKDKALTLVRSCLLAFALSFGGAMCLATGFGLMPEHPQRLAVFCGTCSMLCSLMMLHRRGGMLLLCLAALAGGYLWRLQTPWRQLLGLVQEISDVWHGVYGWGYLRLTSAAPGAYPLGLLGCLLSFAVSRAVCRQTTLWLPVLAALLPLGVCMAAPCTPPHPGALLLLLGGMGVLVLSGQVRHQHLRQGNRLAAVAAPVIAASLGLLLWLNPQESYVNRAEAARQKLLAAAEKLPGAIGEGAAALVQRTLTTSSETVALWELGSRQPLNSPVMTVTAGQSGLLYLRQRDYDGYDGKTWTSSPQREEEFTHSGSHRETVTIRTQGMQKFLFLPYYPAGTALLTGGAVENSSGITAYTVTRSILQPSPGTRDAPFPEGVSPYLALPADTRNRVQTVLETVLPGEGSVRSQANRIGDFLRGGEYDLQPEVLPPEEPDFVLWFLESGKRGYCVHFATAAVVLLRSAGIPARYVTGYLVETEADREVTVTAENAHAWAEFYDPGLGAWLVLEATPAAADAPASSDLSESDFPVLEEVSPPGEAQTPAPAASVPRVSPAVLLLLPFAAEVRRALRLALLRRRTRRGSRNEQALQRWLEAERLSRLLGETPREELLSLAQKAKFSPHPLTDRELEQFDSYLRFCRGQLKQKSFHQRLVYRYLYAVY